MTSSSAGARGLGRLAAGVALWLATGCDGCFRAETALRIVSVEPAAVFVEGGETVTVRTSNGCRPAAAAATLGGSPVVLASPQRDVWTFTAPARTHPTRTAEPFVLTCATTAEPQLSVYAAGGNTATSELVFDPALEPAPNVVAFTPAAERASVLVQPTVRFDRPLDPATVTAETFVLEGREGSVRWDASTRTATLVPASPLAFDTVYRVRVRGGPLGVRTSVAGKPLAEDVTYEFRTRARGDGDPWVGEVAAGAGAASGTRGRVTGVVGGVAPVGEARTASGSYRLVGGFTFSPPEGAR